LLFRDTEARLVEHVSLKIFFLHKLVNCQVILQAELLTGIKGNQARLSFRLRRIDDF
jgi:hypothetical protein